MVRRSSDSGAVASESGPSPSGRVWMFQRPRSAPVLSVVILKGCLLLVGGSGDAPWNVFCVPRPAPGTPSSSQRRIFCAWLTVLGVPEFVWALCFSLQKLKAIEQLKEQAAAGKQLEKNQVW